MANYSYCDKGVILRVLITGVSGYYGSILTKYLLNQDIECVGIDLVPSDILSNEKLIICNLCDSMDLEQKLRGQKFDAIIHLASQIDFAVRNQRNLYDNNVVGTRNIAKIALALGIKNFIFTSSNSIFLGVKNKFIRDDDAPSPIDMYGRSKCDSESILLNYQNKFHVNILRCPNIIDAGRVGMLSVLFELVRSNATLWVLGDGGIRHQCLYAQDLNTAVVKLLSSSKSSTYNIGSSNVPSFLEMFQHLIKLTNSKSKIRSIPATLAIPILKLCYKFHLSPLGPYQFRMLTQDFEFDLSKITAELGWKPTQNNSQILEIAYRHYCDNIQNIQSKKSANSAPVKMGILGLLKLFKW